MEEELKKLKSVLRSLVVSCPTQVDARSLLRDYRQMIGAPIPINKYGFRDPITFLKEQCSDSFLFQGPPSNPVLTLIVPDTLKHIDKFVQNQKSTPSTKFKGKRRSVLGSTIKSSDSDLIVKTFSVNKQNNADISKNIERNRQNNATCNGRIINDAKESNNEYIDKKMQQNHNGTSSIARRHPPSCSRTHETESSLSEHDSGKHTLSSDSSTKRTQLAELIEEITSIVSEHPDGLWSTDILKHYRERHGADMNFMRFGYTSIVSVVQLAPSLSAAQVRGGDWRVWRGPGDAPPPPARAPPPAARAPAPRTPRTPRTPPVDPDDALPGVDFEADVFPADCLHFTESIPPAALGAVRAGDLLEVTVGEVYSPSHFWLLRLGDQYNLAMEDIMDEMTAYYGAGAGRERRLAPGAVRVGHYCSSCYEGDWHRSVIVKIIDSDTVKVRHVDYGTVEAVPAAALRPLRRPWARLPAQAVRARLAAAAPPAAGRRWPRAAAAAFLALVRDRRLVADVLAVDPEDGILEVMLVDTSTEDDVCISSELVRAGHADPRRRPAPATSECYLWPKFSALENGDTPNYAEIHAYLRDGVVLEFLEEYRRHVPSCLPSPPPTPPSPPTSPTPPTPSTPPSPQYSPPPLPPPPPQHPSFPGAPTPRLLRPAASPLQLPPADGGCDRTQPPASPFAFPHAFQPPPPACPSFPPPCSGTPGTPGAPGLTIPASECEIFHLLSRVDPAAAQRYIVDAVGRAMRTISTSCWPRASVLNPDAPEYRAPAAGPPPAAHPAPAAYPAHPAPAAYPAHPAPAAHPAYPASPAYPPPAHTARPTTPFKCIRPPPGFENMY